MLQLDCRNTIFLLVLNDNLPKWPNSGPVRYISFQNLIGLGFELSKSLKVKYHVVLPICFLLVFNGNVWPNSVPLQYTLSKSTDRPLTLTEYLPDRVKLTAS